MQTQNPGSDEEAWLSARAAELAASSRIRQRREWERFARRETQLFETRQRQDEQTLRLAKFVLFVIAACLAILVIAFAPIWWDLLHHWHTTAPGMLRAVAFAPPLLFPLGFLEFQG